MSTIINGSSPSITFSDSTTQTTAFTGSASQITSGTLPSAQLPAGSVLQVVQGTLGTTVSTASSTYSDTGLTATITPKFSTSKILVMITLACCGKYSGNTSLALKVLRNGSQLLIWDDSFGYTATTAQITAQAALNYLDSPATTSATTYKLQFSSISNVANAIINNTNGTGGNSFITLMEIAG